MEFERQDIMTSADLNASGADRTLTSCKKTYLLCKQQQRGSDQDVSSGSGPSRTLGGTRSSLWSVEEEFLGFNVFRHLLILC